MLCPRPFSWWTTSRGLPGDLPHGDATMSGTICPHCGDVHEPEAGLCHQPPLEGRTLPDGFRVLGALGQTSLGALYRAEDSSSHVEVEVLLLHPHVPPGLRVHFLGMAAIKHPNVAGVCAVGQTPEGVCYVVLEVVQGKLLSEILQTRHTLPLAEAADLVLQAAAGLQAVNRMGFPHGNLSPETILVTRAADDRPLVKLIRLGEVWQGTEPSAGSTAGSRYAAPEQLAGHPLDERGDVFSLGAVLLRLLTRAPSSAVPGKSERVTDAVWPVISKALDSVPDHRFPTVAAFAEALAQVTRGTQTWASRAAARRTRAAGVIAAGLIATVSGLWLMRNAQRFKPGAVLVEQATARDTGAVPEPWESEGPPSDAVDTAPAPQARQAHRSPASEPSGRSPTNLSPAIPESTADVPPALAMPKPAPPESLELDARLRESLRLPLPPAAVVAPPDTATVAPPAPRPVAAERVAPTPAPRANSEAEARAAVEQAVTMYARALESKDLRAVEWAYPELTEREREAWKKFFSVARDLVVTLDIDRYAIAGSEAKLDVRGTYQYWNRSLHRSHRAPVRFLATLKRRADGWRFTAIR